MVVVKRYALSTIYLLAIGPNNNLEATVKLAAVLRLGLSSIRREGEPAQWAGRVLPRLDSYSACVCDDSFDWSLICDVGYTS
jgi:hypothetical protein